MPVTPGALAETAARRLLRLLRRPSAPLEVGELEPDARPPLGYHLDETDWQIQLSLRGHLRIGPVVLAMYRFQATRRVQ